MCEIAIWSNTELSVEGQVGERNVRVLFAEASSGFEKIREYWFMFSIHHVTEKKK